MNFDWNDYLELAKSLVSASHLQELLEARQRCTISRAYYAAFCLAKKKVTLTKTIRQGQNSHDVYIQVFFENDDMSVRRVGANLQRMKKCREKADYEDEFQDRQGNIEDIVDEVIEYADEIISFLSVIPSGSLVQSNE